MKQTITHLCRPLAVVSLFSLPLLAASSVRAEVPDASSATPLAATANITYTYDAETKTATVSTIDRSYAGALEIPSTVTYNGTEYTVTVLGINALSNCKKLTSVTLPNTVTTIGNRAFADNPGLVSVGLPTSVTKIDASAFYDCTALESVTIPNSVTSLGNSVFQGCTSLKSMTLPNSLTELKSSLFANCTSLSSVTIPASVTTFSADAFEGCTGLTSLTVEEGNASYTASGNLVFSADGTTLVLAAGGLTDVTIPETVTTIGEKAFGRSSLQRVSIPAGVTTIKASAFADCASLAALELPEGVTTIEKLAFDGCTSLTSVVLPNSVTTVGNYLFYDCTGLTSVSLSAAQTALGEYMFGRCTGLTQVVIPGKVAKIGSNAFYQCTGLADVTIPASVTEIGDNAFFGCTSLTGVTLPNKLKTLGKQAFNSSGLTGVVLPASVTSLGSAVFSKCPLAWMVLNKDLGMMNYINLKSLSFACAAIFVKDAALASAEGGLGSNYALYPLSSFVQVTDTVGYPTAVAFKVGNNPLVGNEYATVVGDVVWGDNVLTPDKDGNYVVTGLAPATSYTLDIAFRLTADDDEVTAEQTVATADFAGQPTFEVGQTSVRVKVALVDDPYGEAPAEYGVNDQKADAESYVTLTGLRPNTEQTFRPYMITADGTTYHSGQTYRATTTPLAPTVELLASGPTTLSLEGSHAEGDAVIAAAGFVGDNTVEGTVLNLTGLDPGQPREVVFYVRMEDGYEERDTLAVTTAALTWEALPVEELTETTAQIGVETNIADGEAGTGLEWRTSGAAETEPSAQEACDVVDGRLTLRLTGLTAATEYAYRACYTSASGATYYSEWQTFTTGVPTGMSGIEAGAGTAPVVVARYAADGRRIAAPQKGLNVVRYSDGSVRRVMVR